MSPQPAPGGHGFVASVIIPAHNEANVIGRCLSGVVVDSTSDFEIVVVSNGSTDTTESVAREHLSGIPTASVKSIDAASKIAALRMGDRSSSVYPRIYLDADVMVSYRTLVDMASALRDHAAPTVGAPTMVVNTTGCNWILRAYHNVWTRLPYVSEGVIGAGVYGVNESGGLLKGEFPEVINDDAYVRGIFNADNRIQTPGYFMISSPRTVTALIKRRARVHIGNVDVESEVTGSGRSTTNGSLFGLVRTQQVPTVEVVVYLAITLASIGLSRIRRLRGSDRQWSTDITSRTPLEDFS